MYFDTINDLKIAFPTSVPTSEFIVGGYYAAGDGGGGTFVWVPVSVSPLLADDGGISIRTDSSYSTFTSGYFKRIYSGPINVRWFGAIISAASGLTDVTTQVNAARDSQFTKNGSIYFPADFDTAGNPNPYIGQFGFFISTNSISILGDGYGSVLKGNNPAVPVLKLGYHIPHFVYPKISNIVIDGSMSSGNPPVSANTDGVVFEDDDDPSNTSISGRWTFENVTFQKCIRGVYKPAGNIGNTYVNCFWTSNDYGYYAEGYTGGTMHAGADKFIGGAFQACSTAAMFYKDHTDGGIQIIVDGTIFERNDGFAVFMVFTNAARMTGQAVCMRNVWMELNGGHISSGTWINHDVVINGGVYPGRDYYFEGIKTVRIDDGGVGRITLVDASVNLYNCRSDDAGYGYAVDVDATSSLVAYELRYNFAPSENIFVQSISYDITGYLPKPTSVWGPLRVITQTGTKDIMVSQRYDKDSYTFQEFLPGVVSVTTSPVHAGILENVCASLTLWNGGGPVEVADMSNIFTLDAGEKYYVWSIHAYHCQAGDLGTALYGLIADETNSVVLGQVILKFNQWVCSYGVKKLAPGEGDPTMYLKFGTNATQGTVLFCDY